MQLDSVKYLPLQGFPDGDARGSVWNRTFWQVGLVKVEQYTFEFWSVFALNANAPATIEKTAMAVSMIFTFFIIKVLFKIKKLNFGY